MNKDILKKYLESSRIISCISVLILYNFIMALIYSPNVDFISAFLMIISNHMYTTILSIIFLMCTISTMINCDTSHYVIQRMKSKKQYFWFQLKYVFAINLIIFIVNLMFLFTCLNLFANNMVINVYMNYNFSNLIYTVFIIFKHLIVYLFLNYLFLCIVKLFDSKISLIINGLICTIPLGISYMLRINNTNNIMQLLYWNHLKIQYYSSFSVELITFIKFILFSFIIVLLVYKFTIIRVKNGEIK